MKKFFLRIISCCLILMLLSLSFAGCNEQENRFEANGVIWEYRKLSNGTLSIYPAYEKVGSYGRKFLSDLSGEVRLPAEINGVSVTEVESGAFLGCTEIEEAVIPEGITKIGQECFFGCIKLQKLDFPDTLKYCGENAISKTALKRISVGKNFCSFGESDTEPFFGCTCLKEIIVSSENEHYASKAGVLFTKDMKTLLLYPSAYEVSQYSLPDTVKKIEKGAFSECCNLNALTFPKSLEKIEDTFYRCDSLKEIRVPKEYIKEYKENELLSGFTVKAV